MQRLYWDKTVDQLLDTLQDYKYYLAVNLCFSSYYHLEVSSYINATCRWNSVNTKFWNFDLNGGGQKTLI